MQLMVFSKHLIEAPLEETALRLCSMGIEKIDLTVRAGGHVEPGQVEDKLPQVAQILGERGVSIGMLTTSITDLDGGQTEKILRTAAKLGVGYYKLGYYIYDGFGTIRRQREEVAARWRDLAALNKECGIRGGFHNHSGPNFGASLWDVAWALESIDPAWLGAYYDGMHATVEGGRSGWLQGLDLIIDRVIMLAVKDFRWVDAQPQPGGGQTPQLVPVGTGNVAWLQILRYLQERQFDGPVSLHSEYQGPHSWRDLSCEEVFAQTARDVITFRNWLNELRD